MKTLNEFNEMHLMQRQIKNNVLSGVACPDCNTEMNIESPSTMLLSDPPKQQVKCPNCGKTGYKFC